MMFSAYSVRSHCHGHGRHESESSSARRLEDSIAHVDHLAPDRHELLQHDRRSRYAVRRRPCEHRDQTEYVCAHGNDARSAHWLLRIDVWMITNGYNWGVVPRVMQVFKAAQLLQSAEQTPTIGICKWGCIKDTQRMADNKRKATRVVPFLLTDARIYLDVVCS